ncbi:hypothetical protein [Actinomadura litoris]|uniref:Uncharacterized protein n=1 Tax=Actinomadura litoris TaxID=2678616 RepID=A0A7K1KZF2_9ACTN|nr:hypothetical protein [Actinomadura litoris]MUN37346.1 hypothetical protein [Actinomadura litoris]
MGGSAEVTGDLRECMDAQAWTLAWLVGSVRGAAGQRLWDSLCRLLSSGQCGTRC